jgi:hypothetical protein
MAVQDCSPQKRDSHANREYECCFLVESRDERKPQQNVRGIDLEENELSISLTWGPDWTFSMIVIQ